MNGWMDGWMDVALSLTFHVSHHAPISNPRCVGVCIKFLVVSFIFLCADDDNREPAKCATCFKESSIFQLRRAQVA